MRTHLLAITAFGEALVFPCSRILWFICSKNVQTNAARTVLSVLFRNWRNPLFTFYSSLIEKPVKWKTFSWSLHSVSECSHIFHRIQGAVGHWKIACVSNSCESELHSRGAVPLAGQHYLVPPVLFPLAFHFILESPSLVPLISVCERTHTPSPQHAPSTPQVAP